MNVGCLVILQEIMKGVITHLASCSSMYSKEGKNSDRDDAGGHHVVISVCFVSDKFEKSPFCDQKLIVIIIPEKFSYYR